MKLLLARAGALGDLLLLRPTIAALREAGHEVRLLAPRSAAAAVCGPGPWEAQELIPWERPEVGSLLAGETAPTDVLAGLLSGLDLAVAYTRSEALVRGLARVVPAVRPLDPAPVGVHASLWLLRPVADLVTGSSSTPALAATPEEAELARPLLDRLPDRFLAVHPGAGSPAKAWPGQRFVELVEALAGGGSFLLVEGPADAAAAAPARRLSGAVLARDLPVRVLGAALARAGTFVGNDSGVSHLAAACGAPTLALFGPTDPALWAPLGERAATLRSPTGAMGGLTLEAVLAAVRELPAPPRRGAAPE